MLRIPRLPPLAQSGLAARFKAGSRASTLSGTPPERRKFRRRCGLARLLRRRRIEMLSGFGYEAETGVFLDLERRAEKTELVLQIDIPL